MVEVGLVTALTDGYATVKIDKKEECSKCGMCLFPKNAQSIEVKASDPIGCNEGDKVVIETCEELKLLGAVLVFLVPLLLIGLSVLIGYIVIKSEIWILILSVIFVVLWYTILALIDKKLKTLRSFNAVIKRVVSED
ncbi:MAG: hypothetical protein E7369_06020 [Clostridiales bacterium]|nr:hypothetical protein [Clostridiales bacterium]